MLSFSDFDDALGIGLLLRSISMTAAGAWLTKLSLPSFFSTPCRNPSLCFSSASMRAISASTIYQVAQWYGISVVPTMNEAAPSALASTTVMAARLHIL